LQGELTTSGCRPSLCAWNWTLLRCARLSRSPMSCTSAAPPPSCSSPSKRCPSASSGWSAPSASHCLSAVRGRLS
jgi:hypothetical protein